MKKKLKYLINYEGWFRCLVFMVCLLIIAVPLIIYASRHITKETHFEKGIVLDRDRSIRTDVTHDSDGNPHFYESVCYETQVKMVEDGYVFIDRSPYAYEHTVEGEKVEVEVTVTYWKGQYWGTTYNVR